MKKKFIDISGGQKTVRSDLGAETVEEPWYSDRLRLALSEVTARRMRPEPAQEFGVSCSTLKRKLMELGYINSSEGCGEKLIPKMNKYCGCVA